MFARSSLIPLSSVAKGGQRKTNVVNLELIYLSIVPAQTLNFYK